jgi:hypothetical protein
LKNSRYSRSIGSTIRRLCFLFFYTREAQVDSGPLIDGVSLPASVVTIALAHLVGDDALANTYLHLGEAMGRPMAWYGKRRYFFGQLPIADAFFVYARTTNRFDRLTRHGRR